MTVGRLCLRQGRRVFAPRAPPCAARAVSTTTTTTTIQTPETTPIHPSPDAADSTTPQKGTHYGGATYVTRRIGPNVGDISKTYRSQQRLEKIFNAMGSVPEKRYNPLDVLLDPPRPEDVTLEMLMAAQTHMGHHRSLWNPHNSRYIYGTRQGIHIISLEQTAAHLRRAARVVEEVAYCGGLILFVGNRKGHMPIVAKAAQLAGGCQLFTKWTPGSITNRDLILGRQGLKVVDEHDQMIEGFEAHLNQMRPLVPDLVVCLNPIENFTMLYECGLKSIPTIGVIDTNANPSWVTYTIPANDDSLRSLAVIAGVLGRAGEKGQARRKEAAKDGRPTWEMDKATLSFLSSAATRRRQEKADAQLGGTTLSNSRAEDLDQEAALLGLEEAQEEVSEEDMLEMLASAQEKAISDLDRDDDEFGAKKPAPYKSRAGARSVAAQFDNLVSEEEVVHKPTQEEIDAFWADNKFYDDDVLDEVYDGAPLVAPQQVSRNEGKVEVPVDVEAKADAEKAEASGSEGEAGASGVVPGSEEPKQ